jgi:hypothetical protein
MLLNRASHLEEERDVLSLKVQLKDKAIFYKQNNALLTDYEVGHSMHIFGAKEALRLLPENLKIISHFYGQAATHAWSLMLDPRVKNHLVWQIECARAAFLSIKYLPESAENADYRLDRAIELTQAIVLAKTSHCDPLSLKGTRSLALLDLIIQELATVKKQIQPKLGYTLEKLHHLVGNTEQLLNSIDERESSVDIARLQMLYGILMFICEQNSETNKDRLEKSFARGVDHVLASLAQLKLKILKS